MTYQRLAYDEASSATEMSSDCRAVESALDLPEQVFPVRAGQATPTGLNARGPAGSEPLAVPEATASFAARLLD